MKDDVISYREMERLWAEMGCKVKFSPKDEEEGELTAKLIEWALVLELKGIPGALDQLPDPREFTPKPLGFLEECEG